MKNVIPRFAALVLLLASMQGQTLVGSTPVEHSLQPPITGVQLYSNQALIHRSTKLSVEPGAQSLRVDDLPGTLNEDSVRVALSGTGIKIEEVRVDTEFQKLYRSQEAQAAEARLRSAENELRMLSNRYVMLREDEASIRKIKVGKAPAGPDADRPLDPERWKQTLDFMQAQLQKNQAQTEALLEQIDGAREDLAVAIAVAERFRSGISRSRKTVTVRFVFEGKEKESRDLDLEYRIGGAAWYPVYQARVMSKPTEETAKVRLSMYALVKNETGEDWNNVRPVFSAADPSESSTLPVLSAWTIRSVLSENRKINSSIQESRKPSPASPKRQAKESPSIAAEVVQQREDDVQDLKPKDEAVRQQLNLQTNRSQDYFRKNNEIVQDKRARNRTEQVESLLDEFRSNIEARDRSLAAGQYDRALEYSESVIQNIRSLSPAHQAFFAEEEQKSIHIRRQSLEMLDARKFTERLVLPSVSSRGFDYRYTAARSETIRSDGAFRRIFLFEKEWSASLHYESAPVKAPLAYLVGRLNYSDKTPLLSGPVSVFHNLDYVGEATLPTVSAGEAFSLHLGANEEIVMQRSERTFRTSGGLISRSYTNRTEVLITVRNGRRSNVELELLERIPVSGDERVKVETVSVEPTAADTTERGILRFRLQLKSGEVKKLRIVYDLTHPADVLPVVVESGAGN